MIVINQAQLDKITESQITAFFTKVKAYLLREHNLETGWMTTEELDALINEAIQRAGNYKMYAENSIVSFLNLMLVLGNGFDQGTRGAAIRNILDTQHFPDAQRFTAVSRHLQGDS